MDQQKEELTVEENLSEFEAAGRVDWSSLLMINPSAPVVLAFQWNQCGPKAGKGSACLSAVFNAASTGSQTPLEDTAQVLIPVYGL